MRTSGAPLRCTSPPAWPSHSFTHKTKLDTLYASAQLTPNLPMATETRSENQHIGVFARYRYEPAYPCTVPGSGACRAGVSLTVAISAQASLPHSSHFRRHSRYICMSTCSAASSLEEFSCGISAALLLTITVLHLHELGSTFGFNFSVGHWHLGVTHHGNL